MMKYIDNLITKPKKTSYSTLKILLTALIAGYSMAGYADLYKWVDEGGVVNYTQLPPPPGIEAELVKQSTGVVSETAQEQLDQRLNRLDDLAKQRQQQSQERSNVAQQKADQQRRCNQARARLASYEKSRVSVSAGDGTFRIIGEEERLVEIERSNTQVRENCN